MRISTEIYTRNVQECKEFYINNFGFQSKMEAEGFVVLIHPIYTAYELLFCIPNSPFVNPLFHPEFSGQGAILQFEIDNVQEEYDRLRTSDVPIVLPLVDESVNGHHFTIRDPSGLLIDIVQYV
jgi:catechol 2,3-dioxygenase-like lactoylglutathione lyase family enzyme